MFETNGFMNDLPHNGKMLPDDFKEIYYTFGEFSLAPTPEIPTEIKVDGRVVIPPKDLLGMIQGCSVEFPHIWRDDGLDKKRSDLLHKRLPGSSTEQEDYDITMFLECTTRFNIKGHAVILVRRTIVIKGGTEEQMSHAGSIEDARQKLVLMAAYEMCSAFEDIVVSNEQAKGSRLK